MSNLDCNRCDLTCPYLSVREDLDQKLAAAWKTMDHAERFERICQILEAEGYQKLAHTLRSAKYQ